MKYAFFLLLIVLAACVKKNPYDPNKYFSGVEKDNLKLKIVRYSTKPPEGVSKTHKLDTTYNKYYLEKASKLILEQLHYKNGKYYFLISQPAPSLTEKRTATGGKLELDKDGNLVFYEEIFRTWKMVPDTLKARSYFLFDKMCKGESLDQYYPNITGDKYIEFPDNKTFFDVKAKSWKVKN